MIFTEVLKDIQDIKDWVNGLDSVPWGEEVDAFFKPYLDKWSAEPIMGLEGNFELKLEEDGHYYLQKMVEQQEEKLVGTDIDYEK